MLEILIVVLVIAADQATKAIAAKILPTLADSTYPLWEGVFHFTYVENRGAAFGMLQNKRIVFLVITSISIVLMIWLLISQRKRKPAAMPVLARAGIALILAGAVGNMIDRIWLCPRYAQLYAYKLRRVQCCGQRGLHRRGSYGNKPAFHKKGQGIF